MEDYKEIIEALKKQRKVEPPDDLTGQVLAKLAFADKPLLCKIRHYLFHAQLKDNETEVISSGAITSHRQCAFLLFLVGFFYLVAGLTILWRLPDTTDANPLSFWLNVQPLIPIASGIFLLLIAFLVFSKPRTTAFVKYFLIAHMGFILGNALLLEKMLNTSMASMYILIPTILAVALSILLIASIRSALKYRMLYEDVNGAKTS